MRRIFPLILLLALVLSACNLPIPTSAPAAANPSGGQATNPATAAPAAIETPAIAYGAQARDFLKAITDFGPRVAGSEAESNAALYISNVLSGLGYQTEVRVFHASDDSGKAIDSANVVAIKQGRSAQEIIVGAHYDSAADGQGADDNASGVAAMLEAATLVQNIATPYTIRFIAFGAEEAGLLGSYAYVNQMSQAEFENTVAMINLDSLAAGDVTYIYSDEEPQSALRDWTLEWAFGNGLDLQTIRNVDLTDEYGNPFSDHGAFRNAGIPFIYFEATNWNLGDEDGYTQVDPQYGEQGKVWHTPYDTLEYLDSTFPGRVDQHLSLFVQLLYAILTQYEAPAQ